MYLKYIFKIFIKVGIHLIQYSCSQWDDCYTLALNINNIFLGDVKKS